jgi:hypothetical protein
MDMPGKKRASLEKNPVDLTDSASEAKEAVPAPKTESKRTQRTNDDHAQQVETNEMSKVEAAEVPTVKAAQLEETKTQEVPEIHTNEVQELQASTPQTGDREQIQGEETFELETIIQGLDIHPEEEAFLEADPLYREYREAQLPKYQRLDVKLYVLLRDDQLEFLARLTREIMKNRTSAYKKERITKNTIIRALVDNLKELKLDVRNIPDEIELTKRIADVIKSV